MGFTIRTSLGMLAATGMGISGYTAYQVGLQRKEVFIPYRVFSTSHTAKLSRGSATHGVVTSQVSHRLQDRLAIDEEIHKAIGSPVRISLDENEKEKEQENKAWKVWIRTQGPGVRGLHVTPKFDFGWGMKFGIDTRALGDNSSGKDRVLLPFTPGEADSEDAIVSNNRRDKRTDTDQHDIIKQEAIVTGTVGVNGVQNHQHCKATVQFTAVQRLDHPNSVPKFTSGVLECADGTQRRLW